MPAKGRAVSLEKRNFVQPSPSVQYRGIFINDERFGGWAKWVEQTFDKETGQVGPKVYEKVFELMLRLKANYLWPAMHNGSRAFNADPRNAAMAHDYAIVMGSSHCEQMLRNNEDEWKNAGTFGDFNYLTNRQTMLKYWEDRVKTNGQYENIYTLGLRGIHDYPMEGANTTRERVALMQKAINDQRDILRRNVSQPVEQVPQILCTYEEVLDAYHDGLQVPDDVTFLWCDDKHGYTRNLSNPDEQKRKGGAGIYYHLSYHGDPASWIWLSPLSPAFISTELTKAYTYGAQKIWIFNVGDIKPAEKELSFAMALAWDINKWKPELAHKYIEQWAEQVFGKEAAAEIADIQNEYYRLQASGKDSHVYFVNYTSNEIQDRLQRWAGIARRAHSLMSAIPERLKDAYFELVLYPVKGAAMLNEYQLLARRSMTLTTAGKYTDALAEATRAKQLYDDLDAWTAKYHTEIQNGKWDKFFCWKPYHLYSYNSEKLEAPSASEQTVAQAASGPKPMFLPVESLMSENGLEITADSDCLASLWIEALTPIDNFSKLAKDNEFCTITANNNEFTASATPINNVWHAPFVGPMWSKVGTVNLRKGSNVLRISNVKPAARIDSVFLGPQPPFAAEPGETIKASQYSQVRNGAHGQIATVPMLGYTDGVLVLPFGTPSIEPSHIADAPCVEYTAKLDKGVNNVEIRTLPTLHVYEGREARYAVSVNNAPAEVFSIHTEDFTPEWRINVLRGYSSRKLQASVDEAGECSIKIYLLDPGIVLQEIRIN